MKLTKYQKARLIEYGWKPLVYNDNGIIDNSAWIQIDENHSDILEDLCDRFHLDCKQKKLKLLIVATNEEEI
jgi:hypothetical protein